MATDPLRFAGRRSVSPPVVRIPAGRLLMGSETGRPDESPIHSVDVGAFCIARTAITNEQYAPFLETARASSPPWWTDPPFAASDQPVVGITWFDAVAYGAWLSETVGGVWRLPTEAEWEWAARGGLVGAATAWGETLPAGEVPDGPLTAPWAVGRGAPNGYGLCDIGTIVHEWCLDSYRPDSYAPARADDAVAGHPPPRSVGERRASRGGSWRHLVRWSPPAARSSLPPGFRYADYGFRIVQEVS
jgi:formylglycine-generating enzyme